MKDARFSGYTLNLHFRAYIPSSEKHDVYLDQGSQYPPTHSAQIFYIVWIFLNGKYLDLYHTYQPEPTQQDDPHRKNKKLKDKSIAIFHCLINR